MTDGSSEETVEFICPPFLEGKIAPPKPAHEIVPDWYRNLPIELDGERTVKNCMPFLEALTTGWILPVPVDIRLTIDPDEMEMTVHNHEEEDPIFEPVMGQHDLAQLGYEMNPMGEIPIVKFNIPWVIDSPEGVSFLFVPPMNRHEPRFRPFCGIVQTDDFYSNVNIPSAWIGGSFDGVIEKGTPLAHLIPLPTEGMPSESTVRAATPVELSEIASSSDAHRGIEDFYRDMVWEPIDRATVETDEVATDE